MLAYASKFHPAKMEVSLRQFLIMLSLWLFCFQLHVGSVRSQCLEDQQALLLQLKNGLNFDPSLSVKLVKWNQRSDCCSWDGVRCDAGGRVIDVDLSSESISGGIDNSSSLLNLQYLQGLNLANNSFNSSIPPGIDKLTNLSYLNLSRAGFSGQIPLEISRITSLVTLDLSVDFFLGTSMKLENPNLAMLVRNLKELKRLYLDGVDLSAQGKEWCQALSNSLPKLEELSMSNCLLSGPIDSSLSKLQYLSVIHLNWNYLSAPIPEFFSKLSNLTSLNLAATNSQGKVPVKIFQLLTLKTLDLSDNPSLEGSLTEFSQASSLEALLLSETGCGGNLPKSIGNLRRLSRIELESCNFNGSIPDTIGKLTQLVSLDFSMNGFSGPMPSFSSVRNLTQLNLAHNNLTGSIFSTNWSGLLMLESINLRNNSLNGTIPTSLFGIPTLQRMELLQNLFTGELSEPSEITSFSLDTVDLSGNKLAGPFPLFLYRLQSLKILNLAFNNFSGLVNLSSFQKLEYFSHLDLSHNSLFVNTTGIDHDLFPKLSTLKLASCNLRRNLDFLKKQTKLADLDLSDNQIGGEIPSWIWSFDLEYLNLSHNCLVKLIQPPLNLSHFLFTLVDLSNNNLQGQLPRLPPSATIIDYSGNNFSSVIPDNIGEFLNFAYSFSLSNNNLYGSIPQSICNAPYLAVLNLSNNSMSGTIPQCLFGLKFIRVLDLGANKLSGSISNTFSTHCGLQTIALNGNQLEGKIPRSLAKCKQLEVLDFGNNQIIDVFPCHLKSISTLRVLVLRANRFRGPIGCSNDNSWKMLQIVDLAYNNFSGELPDQSLRTWKAMMDAGDALQHISYKILPLNQVYYQDAITVIMKSLEIQLVKILTVYTIIDFSCNQFEGTIPEVIREFDALYTLNLSHNSFTSLIPPFLGNLRHLESLDLSSNELSGEIPPQLGDLYFLEVLNLSYNHLEGRIPSGYQLQTFSEDSYRGNKGLCGGPLKERCTDATPTPPDASEDNHSDNGIHVDWNFVSVELGVVFGLGIVVFPLMFWRRWRLWYCKHIDALLSWLLPQLNQRNRNRGSRTSRRTRARAHLMERNKMVGEAALQPQVSKHRAGRRTGHVVVV